MEHVEAVIMRGGQPRFGGLRSTLCISSQVGCKMGYKFCATRSMGFKNNLPLEEIVEQLVHASHLSQIRNIVFMIAASPQTCPANIGKRCGDDWEGEFFPGIPKIKYESPSSKSPLAFKWYNAEEEILGKKMSVFPFSLFSLSPLSQLLLLFLLLSSQEKDILTAPMEENEQKALYYATQGFVEKWWNGSDLYPDPCGWTPI